MNVHEEILAMQRKRLDGVLITVIECRGHGPSAAGKKMLLRGDGVRLGTVGGGELEQLAGARALELLKNKAHAVETYDLSGNPPAGTGRGIDMLCGGTVTLYFEYLPVRPVCYIFGAGHVGRSLLYLLKNLDYLTILVDNRPAAVGDLIGEPWVRVGEYTAVVRNEPDIADSYTVIAAYSHQVDLEILEAIYEAGLKPRYIGLLASPAKAAAILGCLGSRLGKDIDLSPIHAPAGLDIGGDSPEEIAVSILSEMQAVRYGREGHVHLGRHDLPDIRAGEPGKDNPSEWPV